MSLSQSYFSKVSPVVYDAFRNSSEWHKHNVPAYSALSNSVRKQIEVVIGRAYHDIVGVMLNDEAGPPDTGED